MGFWGSLFPLAELRRMGYADNDDRGEGKTGGIHIQVGGKREGGT